MRSAQHRGENGGLHQALSLLLEPLTLQPEPPDAKFCHLVTVQRVSQLECAKCCSHLHLQGVDINPEDNMGDTPLMDAIRQGHMEVQDVLRQHGGHVGSDNVAYRVCEAAAENRLPALQVRPGPLQYEIHHQSTTKWYASILQDLNMLSVTSPHLSQNHH